MSARKLNSYDGIGTWKRRPIRASKKTYMPSHKRWGKVITMPVPEGFITTSKIWTGQSGVTGPEDVQLPEEPTEVEQKEEEREPDDLQ